MFHTLYISSTSCNGFGKMSTDKLCGETVGIIQQQLCDTCLNKSVSEEKEMWLEV